MTRAVALGRGLVAMLLALSVSAAPGGAGADEDRADARIELSVETDGVTPYAQEMILLRIRGWYGVPITRETLVQPDMADFAWMQLGRDRWFEGAFEGRQLRAYERTMALFPQRAGELVVPPFLHDLKLMSIQGQRFEAEIASPPLTITVAAPPTGAEWWLPAASARLVDTWDRRPDQLEFGQSAVRTVTLIAAGVAPEMLPPTPVLNGPGIHIFPHPEERARNLTPEGPVSSVTWRWTVTLLRPEAAILEEVRIPWFDTRARAEAELLLPAYRVAIRGQESTVTPSPVLRWITAHARLAGGLAGGLLGLAILFVGMRTGRADPERARRLARRRSLREMTRAARQGAAARLRTEAYRFGQVHATARERTALMALMTPLDRSLFEGAPGPGRSALRALARDITALLR